MKLKKALKMGMLGTLTVGAAIGVGFLSFSGMYFLLPLIPVAGVSFWLSIGYDGEIYLQNIKGALSKLYKPHHLRLKIAKKFLDECFPELDEFCPKFFKDYQEQLDLLQLYEGISLTKEGKKRKAQIQKTLKRLEEIFERQLFCDPNTPPETTQDKEIRSYIEQYRIRNYIRGELKNLTPQSPLFFHEYKRELMAYESELYIDELPFSALYKKNAKLKLQAKEKWLMNVLLPKQSRAFTENEMRLREYYQQHHVDFNSHEKKLTKIKKINPWFIGISVLTAGFTALGTVYLLASAAGILMTLIPAVIVPALPAIIISFAVLAGLAYGLQNFNAMSDFFVHNETLQNWYRNIKENLRQKASKGKGIRLAIVAALLITLAIVLSLCTVFSWWSILSAVPVFTWLVAVPVGVIAVGSLFNFMSTLIFNLENTSETIHEIQEGHNAKHEHVALKVKLKMGLEHFKALPTLEKIQIINIPGWVFQSTFFLLTRILFAGHLLSMAATSDRVFDINKYITAAINILGELLEDWHYFIPGHHHKRPKPTDPIELKAWQAENRAARLGGGSGHNHSVMTVPVVLLLVALLPLITLASCWDYVFSSGNRSFKASFWKQLGRKKEEVSETNTPGSQLSPETKIGLAHLHLQKEKERLQASSGNKKHKELKIHAIQDLQHQFGLIEKSTKTVEEKNNEISYLLNKATERPEFSLPRYSLFAPKVKHIEEEMINMKESVERPMPVAKVAGG